MITLHVERHRRLSDDPFLIGTVKIKGDLHVDHDLQGGQDFRVTVADSEGTVICSAKLVCATPTFKDIVEKNIHIGVERIHVLAVTHE